MKKSIFKGTGIALAITGFYAIIYWAADAFTQAPITCISTLAGMFLMVYLLIQASPK